MTECLFKSFSLPSLRSSEGVPHLRRTCHVRVQRMLWWPRHHTWEDQAVLSDLLHSGDPHALHRSDTDGPEGRVRKPFRVKGHFKHSQEMFMSLLPVCVCVCMCVCLCVYRTWLWWSVKAIRVCPWNMAFSSIVVFSSWSILGSPPSQEKESYVSPSNTSQRLAWPGLETRLHPLSEDGIVCCSLHRNEPLCCICEVWEGWFCMALFWQHGWSRWYLKLFFWSEMLPTESTCS